MGPGGPRVEHAGAVILTRLLLSLSENDILADVLFEFDADQRLWQDTVREVVAKQCPPSLVRGIVDSDADPDPLWRTYVKLGWTELTEPAQAVELAIVVEELGRAVDPTPYLATMTQFAPLAPAFVEPGSPGAAVLTGVSASPTADGWRLDGTARHVLDGDRADRLAVVTRAGVFVVPAGGLAASAGESASAGPLAASAGESAPAGPHAASAGESASAGRVRAVRTPIFDPVLHVAEVSFNGVPVTSDDRSPVDPERARHLALTGLALTTVGACRRILDMAVDHVRTRNQFGAPIGSFQAVQHKAADMHVAIERARALAYFAALTIGADDPRRRMAAAMAKAAAGECQALVFRHGLQLFGGMGFTWENDLQLALKRAKAGELLLGGASEHRARIAEEYRAADL
jgi:alkylation response protein AidB-like acyl-CoA dehydrogenase